MERERKGEEKEKERVREKERKGRKKRDEGVRPRRLFISEKTITAMALMYLPALTQWPAWSHDLIPGKAEGFT